MVHWFIFTASFVLTLALIPPFVYLAALTAADWWRGAGGSNMWLGPRRGGSNLYS